jgi:aminopeptidase N
MFRFLAFYISFFSFLACQQAQPQERGLFTEADSLRGMLRPQRTCYDVLHYHLNLKLNFEQRSITGYNTMRYRVKQGFNVLQIDLFKNMQIDSIVHRGRNLRYVRKHDAVFVDFGEMQEEELVDSICIYYYGVPRMAVNAPWDGGFTWTKDKNGSPWLGVSCEGIGASLWWPNKDHLSDEPDSMRITCTVPSNLVCVSNGVLRSEQKQGSQTTYDWFVSYPINNYNVTLNVGNYVHFSDTFVSPFTGKKLPLDYYVLPYNLDKARKQFQQVKPILKSFEKYFDEYPFWNDGYALVETPYLGMEHQGAIAYGNRYMPGYLGRHPKGVPDDFIILHETGHEWWGNSISCRDHGEMWIHESFTTYMEAIFVEDKYNYETAVNYLKYYSTYIENRKPMLGPLDVNFDSHDSDMYYKGALMLHTLRTAINNDSLWWASLKMFYQKHKISSVQTKDFIEFINQQTKQDFSSFFQQFLTYPKLPILRYEWKQRGKDLELNYQWQADIADLYLPIYVKNLKNNQRTRLVPSTKQPQTIRLKNTKFSDFQIEYGLFEVEEKTGR